MDITRIEITKMLRHSGSSCNDPDQKIKTLCTEVSATIFVRDDNAAPFDMKVRINGSPSAADSIKFIEDLLFELG